jgi:hypothetical protein
MDTDLAITPYTNIAGGEHDKYSDIWQLGT